MSTRFFCLTIHEDKRESWDDALSDVLCWMNGFISAGGNYSPETLGQLKDLRDAVRLAYDTLPPITEPLLPVPQKPAKKGGAK